MGGGVPILGKMLMGQIRAVDPAPTVDLEKGVRVKKRGGEGP